MSLAQALHCGSQHLLIQFHGNVVVLGDVLLGTFQLVIRILDSHSVRCWLEGHNMSQHSSCFSALAFKPFNLPLQRFSSGICTSTPHDPNDCNFPDPVESLCRRLRSLYIPRLPDAERLVGNSSQLTLPTMALLNSGKPSSPRSCVRKPLAKEGMSQTWALHSIWATLAGKPTGTKLVLILGHDS